MRTALTLKVVLHAHAEKDIMALDLNVKASDGHCIIDVVCSLYTVALAFLDVDECASSDTNDCHPDASCNNTVGGFNCTCLSGFEGNGTSCTGNIS